MTRSGLCRCEDDGSPIVQPRSVGRALWRHGVTVVLPGRLTGKLRRRTGPCSRWTIEEVCDARGGGAGARKERHGCGWNESMPRQGGTGDWGLGRDARDDGQRSRSETTRTGLAAEPANCCQHAAREIHYKRSRAWLWFMPVETAPRTFQLVPTSRFETRFDCSASRCLRGLPRPLPYVEQCITSSYLLI